MDLAINGGGFFQVSDPSGSIGYSRNGQFKIDQNGYIVNNSSQRLMGYMADNNGVIQPGAAVPLRLPTAGIEPNVTSEMALELNLDKREGITPAASPMIDFDDPETYAEATEATLYDAAGHDPLLRFDGHVFADLSQVGFQWGLDLIVPSLAGPR